MAIQQTIRTTHQLSDNDRLVVESLRKTPGMTVGDLGKVLGVTATAVRQRLDRLMALGLIERSHESEGRGRPSYRYDLTGSGKKVGGNNLEDLAIALWKEVQELPDATIRQKVVAGTISRLVEKYQGEVDGDDTAARLKSLTSVFAQFDIPISCDDIDGQGLPIIRVNGCPYPDLAKDDREICELEKEVMAKVIGKSMTLCKCQQDGDQCCTFRATEE
jgi:predicted ArsR family transcriptional regulator